MLRIHPEVGAAVGDKRIQLLEAALIQELLDPLASGVLPLGVLLGDSLLAAALASLISLVSQVEELAFDGHATSRM
jgi:hypothetical protein